MAFKKLRGVDLPEERQGLIRYTCLTYDRQPQRVRNKIDRLLRECGGSYAAALREVMCGRDGITAISVRHYVSENTLYRLRREFYESWEGKRR